MSNNITYTKSKFEVALEITKYIINETMSDQRYKLLPLEEKQKLVLGVLKGSLETMSE